MVQAGAAGLDVVALTDHDTTAGWAAAIAAVPPGLTLLPGIEISCRWGGPPGISVHLLAYLPDPAHPELTAALAGVRASRAERGRRMVVALAADGVPITWERVLALADGAPVGRPHVARALVEAGLVPTVDAAFASEWLGRRYRRDKLDIEVVSAVRMVRAAGGVPVVAHALAGRRGPVLPDEAFGALAAAGLAGIEGDHPDHDAAARARVRAFAADLGLLVTGSSDFHGTNKTVSLGAETTGPEVYERIVSLATGHPAVAG